MDPCYVSSIDKKTLKNDWGNGKKYPWAESGIYPFVCERKKKNNSFELLLSFLGNIKSANLLFK